MYVNTLAYWCFMILRYIGQKEVKFLSFKKSSRIVVNFVMEGVYILLVESIIILRKIKIK